jgi:cyclophilin family peptidyl-prolyl cis-trans isomerase
MSLRNKLTTRLYLGCIALALASTGMSCNQNTAEVPPIQTGDSEAVEVVEVADPYSVLFETTKGNFTVEVHPDWSPNGSARFKELIEIGYYDQCRFFRVIPGFMVQWGMSGDPKMNAQWGENNIPDDPVKKSNTRGYMTFAKTGMPNSRSTQLFINYGNNASLDGQGFSPFAIVSDGMDVVAGINSEYGERPDQNAVRTNGNEYLTQNFPRLDYILKARIVKGDEQTTNKPVTGEGTSGEEKPEAASGEEPAKPAGE